MDGPDPDLSAGVSSGQRHKYLPCLRWGRVSCTVGVVFAPTSAGAQSGTLSITSSTASARGSVALSGTGFDFSVAVSGSNTQTVAAGQIAYYTIAISNL